MFLKLNMYTWSLVPHASPVQLFYTLGGAGGGFFTLLGVPAPEDAGAGGVECPGVVEG